MALVLRVGYGYIAARNNGIIYRSCAPTVAYSVPHEFSDHTIVHLFIIIAPLLNPQQRGREFFVVAPSAPLHHTPLV